MLKLPDLLLAAENTTVAIVQPKELGSSPAAPEEKHSVKSYRVLYMAVRRKFALVQRAPSGFGTSYHWLTLPLWNRGDGYNLYTTLTTLI